MNILKACTALLLALLVTACGTDNSYDGNFVSPMANDKSNMGFKSALIEEDKILISHGLNGGNKMNASIKNASVVQLENGGKDVSFTMNKLDKDGNPDKNDMNFEIKFINNDTIIMKNQVLLRKDSDHKEYASPYFGEYKGKVRGDDVVISITESKLSFKGKVVDREKDYVYLIPVLTEETNYLLFIGENGKTLSSDIMLDKAGKMYFFGELFIKV